MTGGDGSGPVFVLVHGAFHGGWCWRRVSDRLVGLGCRVFQPTLTGLGERAHLLSPRVGLQTFIDDIVGVIAAEELHHVILVGHSFGGIVITCIADRMPKPIRRLVYLDAIIPESGHSALDLLPSDIADARREAAKSSSGGLTIPVPPPVSFDIPVGPDQGWVGRRLTPHPFAGYNDIVSLDNPVGNGLPRVYLRCSAPPYRAVQPSYARIASESGWDTEDLASGHDAMITAPDITAAALLKWASA